MRRVKTTGHTRMKELGYKRLDVWLTKAQWAELEKLADELGLPVTRLARRMVNYMTRGGINVLYQLRGSSYD